MLSPSVPQVRRRSGKPSAIGALKMIAAKDPGGGPDELIFTAVFNTTDAVPLAPVVASDASKWTGRLDGQGFEGIALTLLSPTSILVEMAVIGPDAGPDEVSYAAAPSDIADVFGRKLAAFSGFPL